MLNIIFMNTLSRTLFLLEKSIHLESTYILVYMINNDNKIVAQNLKV